MNQTEYLKNFAVGDIKVSPQHNSLRLQGHTITVQPKVMSVLCYLAQHPSRVVGNDELLDAVWQGRVVTLASVQKSINALRSAFAELVNDQEFVVYFSKRGYQLLPPVVWDAQDATLETSAQPLPETHSPTTSDKTLSPKKSLRLSFKHVFDQFVPLAKNVYRLVLSLVLLGALGLWYFVNQAPPKNESEITALIFLPSNAHEFPLVAHAHHATPSIDGRKLAYLINTDTEGEQESTLMIRDNSGKEWPLANSNGTWVDLAWSPSGRTIAALEMIRADGLLINPDYYQTPPYIYNFHIFTLDLKGHRLLEKTLLNQWQGEVNSISWWDENSLEFVAVLGADLNFLRYRYDVRDQALTTLHQLPQDTTPKLSRVLNQKTALLALQQTNMSVIFLDERQQTLSQQSIPKNIQDLTWALDGQGVYGLNTKQNKLYYIPIKGPLRELPLPSPLNNLPLGAPSQLKNGINGTSLLISSTQSPTEIQQLNAQHIAPLKNIEGLNKNAVTFSPDGLGILYSTYQKGQSQLWLIREGTTLSLGKIEGFVQHMLWTSDHEVILKINQTLLHYNLNTQQPITLIEDAEHLEPLFYSPKTHELWVIKTHRHARNIWQIHLNTQAHKQLTFGNIGTAQSIDHNIYFQYAQQPGLWLLNTQELNHTLISSRLPQYSRILSGTQKDIYFVTGGPCHESDIQKLNIQQNALSLYVNRSNPKVVSLDFHPTSGLLQMPCRPETYRIYELQ